MTNQTVVHAIVIEVTIQHIQNAINAINKLISWREDNLLTIDEVLENKSLLDYIIAGYQHDAECNMLNEANEIANSDGWADAESYR